MNTAKNDLSRLQRSYFRSCRTIEYSENYTEYKNSRKKIKYECNIIEKYLIHNVSKIYFVFINNIIMIQNSFTVLVEYNCRKSILI